MRVTLSNGQEYSLGFRHYYQQDVTVTGDHFCGHISVKREPVVTECYLKTGSGHQLLFARALACKNPKDNPCKETARQVSLGRLATLLKNEDSAIVLKAYKDRLRTPSGQKAASAK